LPLRHPEEIRLGDPPEAFAARCLELLENEEERRRLADDGARVVAERFSWRQAADCFEAALDATPAWRP
jgi:glycosyltransferase involved in cell wall biosynthesis